VERIQFAREIASIDAPNHTYHLKTPFYEHSTHSEASCFPAHCSIAIMNFEFSEEKDPKILTLTKTSPRILRLSHGQDRVWARIAAGPKANKREDARATTVAARKAMLRLAFGNHLPYGCVLGFNSRIEGMSSFVQG
jgi:hypothetical protein